jgi:SAM-dependent methyltransferase
MRGLPELPPAAFTRQDNGDDLDFYASPRLVTHIDESETGTLTRYYAETIPRDAVLDLMSSWVSHLQADLSTREVIGHGMNATEFNAIRASTDSLSRILIATLSCRCPMPSVDAILYCVGVQYLTRPLSLFAEVRRVLRPDGVIIASYSNRCFPMKACQIASKGDSHFASNIDPLGMPGSRVPAGFGAAIGIGLLERLERREGVARPEFQPLRQHVFSGDDGISCGF